MPKKSITPSKEEETEVEETKEVEPMKSPTLRVKALWSGFSPDCRPYKPSTPIITFPEPLTIVVDVPLESELIDNSRVIMSAQLTNQAEPKPIFTPLGMRYIIDQFESAMKNGEPEQEEETKTSNDEWDEEDDDKLQTAKKEIKKSVSDDEEWEDEDTTTTTKEDEDAPWKEDWEE